MRVQASTIRLCNERYTRFGKSLYVQYCCCCRRRAYHPATIRFEQYIGSFRCGVCCCIVGSIHGVFHPSRLYLLYLNGCCCTDCTTALLLQLLPKDFSSRSGNVRNVYILYVYSEDEDDDNRATPFNLVSAGLLVVAVDTLRNVFFCSIHSLIVITQAWRSVFVCSYCD